MRALGSRRSFNDIADVTELVVLSALPADIVVDRAAATVSLCAGVTYGELARALDGEVILIGTARS